MSHGTATDFVMGDRRMAFPIRLRLSLLALFAIITVIGIAVATVRETYLHNRAILQLSRNKVRLYTSEQIDEWGRVDLSRHRGALDRYNIHGLKCNNPEAGDTHLTAMLRFSNLEFVDVGWTKVSPEFVESIAELKRLKLLNVSGIPLTDRTCAVLAKAPNLYSIGLGNTGVDDDAVRLLVKSKSLRLVALQNTKVTERGKAILSDAGIKVIEDQTKE